MWKGFQRVFMCMEAAITHRHRFFCALDCKQKGRPPERSYVLHRQNQNAEASSTIARVSQTQHRKTVKLHHAASKLDFSCSQIKSHAFSNGLIRKVSISVIRTLTWFFLVHCCAHHHNSDSHYPGLEIWDRSKSCLNTGPVGKKQQSKQKNPSPNTTQPNQTYRINLTLRQWNVLRLSFLISKVTPALNTSSAVCSQWRITQQQWLPTCFSKHLR